METNSGASTPLIASPAVCHRGHHTTLAVIAAGLLPVASLALACTPAVDGPGTLQTPAPLAATATPQPVPAEKLHLVACYDASSSYPPELRVQAQGQVSSMLRSLIGPGFPGALVHERWITHHTRSSEARLASYEIPAVPPQPVADPYPPAPPTPNPDDPAFLYDKDAREAAQSAYESAARDWEAQKSAIDQAYLAAQDAVNDAVAAAVGIIDARDAAIAAAVVPQADGSDIGGCPQKAGDVLQGGNAPKVLIIASDMEPYGQQDIGSLSLSGVRVMVLGFHCDLAVECQERREYWTGIFTAAGAASVDFFDPDQPINGLLQGGTQ